MERNVLLPVLFMFLIVFDGYIVCFGWELRKLLDDNPKDKNITGIADPRPPGPIIGDNKSDPKPGGETNHSPSNSLKKVNLHAINNSTPPVPGPNGSNSTSAAGKPPVTKGDEDVNKNTGGKGDKEKKSTGQENEKNNERKDNQENKKNNEEKRDPEKSPENENNEGEPKKNSAQENKNNLGKGDGENSSGEENNGNSKGFTHATTSESCAGLTQCRDNEKMVACIFKIGSKDLVVLVQNGGNNTIKVKLLMESIHGDLDVAKEKTEQISISLTSGGSGTLTLNAGTGDCVLHMDTPVSEGKSFLRLPSFDRLLTPVNGAYLLVLTVLVFGGTWACCKLRRKKRHDGGVPYQELEMALPESVSAIDVETAEGWDQGWDDDWDEDTAVKSLGRPHVGSISANGLTSRTSNRDGWEDSWND